MLLRFKIVEHADSNKLWFSKIMRRFFSKYRRYDALVLEYIGDKAYNTAFSLNIFSNANLKHKVEILNSMVYSIIFAANNKDEKHN